MKLKENEKCLDRQHFPKHTLKLSYKQLCDYGKIGCKDVNKADTIVGYCELEDISACFSKKQWLTANQYIGLPENVDIIHKSTKIVGTKGSMTTYDCYEYTKKKKPPVMSQEKFLKYKALAPDVMDIMNNQISKDIQCFSNEVSKENIDTCLQQSKKTVEEMITKLIPSKTNTLCKRDNGRLYFIWSENNYHLLINELKALIQRNKENKKCVLTSDNVDQLTECLKKIHP